MHKRDKKDSYRKRIEELIEGGHSGKKRSKCSRRTSDDIILVTGDIDNSSSNITNTNTNITNASTTNTNTNTTTTTTTSTNTTNANTSNVNAITIQRWVPGNAGIHKYSGLNKINL
jgi:hypothetical protein